jgi:RNA polymerase sigma-70 factor, ECF subfamily
MTSAVGSNSSPAIEARSSAIAADVELIARILGGDAALFELVMRRYNRPLFRLARAIVADDDEARDVVQAAYVRAYYRLEQFRAASTLQWWLARIVVNEANARRRRPTLVVRTDAEVSDFPDIGADEPERITMSVETVLRVQQAIDRLPADFRIVFMLRAVEELSVAETAAVLEIKEATVKTRFHRARQLLRASLGEYADDAARRTFPFGGEHCDGIVAVVLASIRPYPQ